MPGRLGRLRTPERFAAVHGLLAEGAGLLECAQWMGRALNTVKRCARAERRWNRRHHPRGALRNQSRADSQRVAPAPHRPVSWLTNLPDRIRRHLGTGELDYVRDLLTEHLSQKSTSDLL